MSVRAARRRSAVFATLVVVVFGLLFPTTSFARPILGQLTQAPADLPRLRAQAGARNLRAGDRDLAAKLAPTQLRTPEGEHAAEHEGVGEVDAAKRRREGAPLSPLHDVFYDTRGLLAKITVQGEGDFVFSYDTVGRNTRLVYPGGFQRDQVFDHEGRLTERCYSHPSGPTRCYRAAYDAVGNPTSLQDPEDTDAITYDDLDRLSSIQRGSDTQTFDYNALGALHTNGTTVLDDKRQRIGGGPDAPSAVPKKFNGTDVTLDGGGRITLLDGVTLKYSRRGALIGATKVSGPTTLGEWYGHDPDGRRISRTVSSTTNNVTTFPDEEYFAWSGANVVARLDKTGAVRQGFLFEGVDKPLRLRDTASNLKYFYELDIAGNVRRVRRADGSDAGGYRYAGFGGELSNDVAPAVDQPLRWKARWWSDFARLYDVRARQWSPGLGSFTSVDEFAFHRPMNTLWGWPGMSPMRWRDPWGRDMESTGAEGWFLHNADNLMIGAGIVMVTALTLGTADAALVASGSLVFALGAAGGVAGYSAEVVNELRSTPAPFHGTPKLCKLADSTVDGAMFGAGVGTLLEFAQAGLLSGSNPSAPRTVDISPRNSQKGFDKHGGDFGLSGPWSPERAADFNMAVNKHINTPGVTGMPGTYRNSVPVTHYFDTSSGVNVMVDANGRFVGGWKLSQEQIDNLMRSGNVQ